MAEIVKLMAGWPTWAGSLPLWIIVITLALIQIWPKMRKMGIEERQDIRDKYLERINELKTEVAECRRNCDEQEEKLMAEIKSLHEEIFGLRKQHIQEQISFINAITQTVDAPQLRLLLNALQSGQRALEAVRTVDGPVSDKEEGQDHG